MIWVFGALMLVLGTFAVWLFTFGNRPARHKFQGLADLPRFLGVLDRYGRNGAILFIEHEGSQRFLQFAKYVSARGEENLHFGFPDAPWSHEYVDTVRDELRAAGFAAYVSDTGEDIVRAFVCVDFLESVDRATHVARIAAGAIGLSEHSRFTVWLSGPIDEAMQHRDFVEEVRRVKTESKPIGESGAPLNGA